MHRRAIAGAVHDVAHARAAARAAHQALQRRFAVPGAPAVVAVGHSVPQAGEVRHRGDVPRHARAVWPRAAARSRAAFSWKTSFCRLASLGPRPDCGRLSRPSFAASSAVNKYAPSETERPRPARSTRGSPAPPPPPAPPARRPRASRAPPRKASRRRGGCRSRRPGTRARLGGEPGSDQTAATTPRLTSVKVQLPPGLSTDTPRVVALRVRARLRVGRPVCTPPIQSPSPPPQGAEPRDLAVGTSTRTMASPAPHVVCSTSASFPSQGSAASGADAYRPGNAPRAVAGPRASAASSTKSATPRTSRGRLSLGGPVNDAQRARRGVRPGGHRARACETYARVAPSGEKRGHSAEETSAVSGSASFAFRFESVSASAGGDREGASKRNKPLGRLKQNTRPRRRDVLLKYAHVPEPRRADEA